MEEIKSLGGFDKLMETLKKDFQSKKKDIKVAINGLEQLELLHLEHMDIILKASE